MSPNTDNTNRNTLEAARPCNESCTGVRAESGKSRKMLRLAAGAALLSALSALAPGANAAVVQGTNRSYQLNGGVADFGGGLHAAGVPTGLAGAPAGSPAAQASAATVTWDYSIINGQVVATSRVRGVLFWDALDPGAARVIIDFKRLDGSIITSRSFSTGVRPGRNANSAANQMLVDTQFASPLLHSVTVRTAQVLPNSSIIVTGSRTSDAPRTSTHDIRINNNHADFGHGTHIATVPNQSGMITFTRTNGTMSAQVNGTLYWDNFFGGGTARMIIDFLRPNGTALATRTEQVNGIGSDANLLPNQEPVNQSSQSGSLASVRLRIGEVVNGQFVGVQSRTFRFE